MSPLHSRGVPNEGEKNRSGCLTLVFSRAQKSAELLHHPYILGGPQQRGTKSEVAASNLPSQGPKWGRNGTAPLRSRGSPTKENKEKIMSGCLTLAFSGAQQGAETLRHSCILGVPNKGEQNQKWMPHCCLFKGPKEWKMLHHPCIVGGR